MTSRAVVFVSGCLLGILLGYSAHDLRQFHRTYVLSDVLVLARHSTSYYKLQTDNGQAFEFKLCADSEDLAEWGKGQTLKSLVYEDRGNCKSIAGEKLGFIKARDDNGLPTLSLLKGE